MRRWLGGALLCASWSFHAQAQEIQEPASITVESEARLTPPPKREWYGWQIIVADVASVGSIVAGAFTRDETSAAFLIGGFGGYVLAAPFVHVGNDERDHSTTSIGLRLGLPVGGGLVGGFVAPGISGCHRDDFGCVFATVAGTVIGGTVGAVTAMTLDAAVIAYHEEPSDGSPRTAQRVVPRLAASRSGFEVGVAAIF
ncbi:MAG: hypothetical protein R3B13_00045 [Polyangiaceae bacterium]